AHILQSNRILLTRGEEGISIFNGDTIEMPATENKRVDVKGIGEIMTAVVNISLVNSGNFYESCKLGNIAAGVAVSKSSTDDVSLRDIRKAKKEYDEWLAQK
ncbi:MAG: PfkB family carbohydrate kinase, partial [Nitrosotalea sp.]